MKSFLNTLAIFLGVGFLAASITLLNSELDGSGFIINFISEIKIPNEMASPMGLLFGIAGVLFLLLRLDSFIESFRMLRKEN